MSDIVLPRQYIQDVDCSYWKRISIVVKLKAADKLTVVAFDDANWILCS